MESRKLPFENLIEGIGSHRITPGLLEMLGVVPALGRPFVDRDGAPGSPDVAIVSDRLARRLFGTPDNAVGQSLPFCRDAGLSKRPPPQHGSVAPL